LYKYSYIIAAYFYISKTQQVLGVIVGDGVELIT